MLEMAFKRIKLPENIISFLLDLYKDKKIKVVTAFSNSKEVVAEDEINQKEVVSSLICCMYYNLLLRTIQEQESLEYSIKVKWPKNLVIEKTKKEELRQAILIYADDTIFIARFRQDLENIIEIANEFYTLIALK
ncbi:16285_t:CDS:1 [Gigaspora margarita]|uniref:16285_t:CDS:1 n=1 Tax=Gigaspora margarita TaxID=4874 RepID=A0ABN7UXE9_GIGMA|nr:16285_t:CDS:1 [Gigaspora margarita]